MYTPGMKRWNHLFEADDKLRALERAWHEQGTPAAASVYIRALRRTGQVEDADRIEASQLLSQAIGRWAKQTDIDPVVNHYTLAQVRTMLEAPTINRVNVLLYDSRGNVFNTHRRLASGAVQTGRISSSVKTWKTRPTHFRVSVKFGTGMRSRDNYHITHENGDEYFRNPEDVPD